VLLHSPHWHFYLDCQIATIMVPNSNCYMLSSGNSKTILKLKENVENYVKTI